MSKLNSVKSKALGMSHGTAANRLRKMILFSLVCQLELNICYRCDKEILTVSDLSIEHKEPWLQAKNPVKNFFDLDNIAFSHLSCNSGARHCPHKVHKTREHKIVAENTKRKEKRRSMPVEHRQAERRARYLKFGC